MFFDSSYKFHILVGNACNWHCPYCVSTSQPHYITKSNAQEFCNNFSKFIEKRGIEVIDRFSLWGGEPLLYPKELKILIPYLSQFSTYRPIRLVTNGSLINQEYIDLFNEYDIYVNVSYHEGQLSDDKWKEAFKIKSCVATSLFTKKNLTLDSFFNKWDYLCNKFGRVIRWLTFPVLEIDNMTSSEYNLSKEDVDIIFKNLYKHLDDIKHPFYNHIYSGLIGYLDNYASENYKNRCCNPFVYSLDLQGNTYTCHHKYDEQTRSGNIFNKIIPINSKSLMVPHLSETCSKCSIRKFCNGGCFRDLNPKVHCYFMHCLYDLAKEIKTNYPLAFVHKPRILDEI